MEKINLNKDKKSAETKSAVDKEEGTAKPIKAKPKSSAEDNARKSARALAEKQKELQEIESHEADLLKRIADAKKYPEYKTSTRDYEERLAYVRRRKDNCQKEMNALQGQKVTEALSGLALLLLGTSISESCFIEVMEMAGANKGNALKVKDKYNKEMSASLKDMNDYLEKHKVLNPEQVKKAEDIMKRKERFEGLFNKKFNNKN